MKRAILLRAMFRAILLDLSYFALVIAASLATGFLGGLAYRSAERASVPCATCPSPGERTPDHVVVTPEGHTVRSCHTLRKLQNESDEAD